MNIGLGRVMITRLNYINFVIACPLKLSAFLYDNDFGPIFILFLLVPLIGKGGWIRWVLVPDNQLFPIQC